MAMDRICTFSNHHPGPRHNKGMKADAMGHGHDRALYTIIEQLRMISLWQGTTLTPTADLKIKGIEDPQGLFP